MPGVRVERARSRVKEAREELERARRERETARDRYHVAMTEEEAALVRFHAAVRERNRLVELQVEEDERASLALARLHSSGGGDLDW